MEKETKGTAFKINQLSQDITSGDPEKQLQAVRSCGEQRIAQLVPNLIELLKGISDPYYSHPRQLMETILWALGEIRAPEALPHLLDNIDNVFYKIQVAAITALGKMESDEAVEPLWALIGKDSYPQFVRMSAVESLGRIANEGAVHYLQLLAHDPKEPALKEKAYQMLSYINGYW